MKVKPKLAADSGEFGEGNVAEFRLAKSKIAEAKGEATFGVGLVRSQVHCLWKDFHNHCYAYLTIRQSCRSQDARTGLRGSF